MWVPRGRTAASIITSVSDEGLLPSGGSAGKGSGCGPFDWAPSLGPYSLGMGLSPMRSSPNTSGELPKHFLFFFSKKKTVKLASTDTLPGACSCVHRCPGTQPCSLVIQDLASSVSRDVLSLFGTDALAMLFHKRHGPSTLVQQDVSAPRERRFQDQLCNCLTTLMLAALRASRRCLCLPG